MRRSRASAPRPSHSLAALVLFAAVILASCGGASDGETGWVGAWLAPASDASLSANDSSLHVKTVVRNETIRAILTPTRGGAEVRVRLSNRFGPRPVTFAQATIALRASGADLVPGTITPLTFGGAPAVTVVAGGEIVSDATRFSFSAFDTLAVSVHVPGDVGMPTEHSTARQTSYLTPEDAGDHTSDESGAAFTDRTTARPFVTGLDVRVASGVGAVVALGDSLTDGTQLPIALLPEIAESLDTNSRYPDYLARRLRAAGRELSVLNAGISGNRLLRDGADGSLDIFGPSALRRLEVDALQQAGVTTLILFIGINDLSQSPRATPRELIAGYRELIDRAHVAGLRVLQATLTPARGFPVFTAFETELETARQEVNQWIRTESPADAVLEFDAAVADAGDPSRIDPRFDGGDHLHFGPAGYSALADAVPLEELLDR